MSRLGQAIKEARTQKGLSPKALGKKVGVSESFIVEVESGRRILNENQISRLSKVLDISLNEAGAFYNTADEVPDRPSIQRPEAIEKPSLKTSKTSGAPAPQWEHAFTSIIKDIPIYNSSMSKVIGNKKLVVIDNKVDGISSDKAFYIKIEDGIFYDTRINQGDLVLIQRLQELQGAGTYLVRDEDQLKIYQVKPLDQRLALLVTHNGALTTKTVPIKELQIIGRCIKAEIGL